MLFVRNKQDNVLATLEMSNMLSSLFRIHSTSFYQKEGNRLEVSNLILLLTYIQKKNLSTDVNNSIKYIVHIFYVFVTNSLSC